MNQILNQSFQAISGGNVTQGVALSYTIAWGVWFWPVLFIAFLGLVAMKSQSPALVAIVTIIGNVGMVLLLPVETSIIFYVILVLCIGINFYMWFGSSRTE